MRMALLEAYLNVKETVIAHGFGTELSWQEERRLEGIDERDFLSEGAWVILASGMREAVVRTRFPRVARAFLGFRSAATIVRRSEQCRALAFSAFRHQGKIDAICELITRV